MAQTTRMVQHLQSPGTCPCELSHVQGPTRGFKGRYKFSVKRGWKNRRRALLAQMILAPMSAPSASSTGTCPCALPHVPSRKKNRKGFEELVGLLKRVLNASFLNPLVYASHTGSQKVSLPWSCRTCTQNVLAFHTTKTFFVVQSLGHLLVRLLSSRNSGGHQFSSYSPML